MDNPFAKEHRPWGTYQIIDQGDGYKVKRLEVYPGAMLSLQIHHYRDEHWTVVSGECVAIREDKEIEMKANDVIFIKKNERHRIINKGNRLCILIEVQYGKYLGEDDIIRLDDAYNRS